MSVLTLAGKAIDWTRPPAPTTKAMWSKRTTSGRPVIGSLRTIAHLDHLDTLARKKYGVGIEVMQGPYNEGVAASEGTHDFDACLDVRIPGVDWYEQQRFFRANGAGAYYRSPAQGFVSHIHYFTLPPREGQSISDDYAVAGFKVGMYVDGGYSLFGRQVASSQIADYYGRRTALAGHAIDPTWFPPNIEATIFDLLAYVRKQVNATTQKTIAPDEIAVFATHGPLARLGGEAGQALWDEWEGSVRAASNRRLRSTTSVLLAADTNKRGSLPRLGAGLRRIGGEDIDLIGFMRAKGGARIKVLKRKRVDLRIDGHDGYGAKVRVTFPSGKRAKFWFVQANLGRGVSDAVFRQSCEALLAAFGDRAVYCFNEIDEADKPKEHVILREVFPRERFRAAGFSTFTPILVGRKAAKVTESQVDVASSGLAKVSPRRVLTQAVLTPVK